MTLIDARRPAACSQYLGLDPYAGGLVSWDVLDAVLTPGDLILLQTWRPAADAQAFADATTLPGDGRLRHVRVVRDYGLFDRREAPQYFPTVSAEPGLDPPAANPRS